MKTTNTIEIKNGKWTVNGKQVKHLSSQEKNSLSQFFVIAKEKFTQNK